MERMTELYEWLTTWDRYVSTEDKKRQIEEPKPRAVRRRKMVRGKAYNDPNASSFASESNTSYE